MVWLADQWEMMLAPEGKCQLGSQYLLKIILSLLKLFIIIKMINLSSFWLFLLNSLSLFSFQPPLILFVLYLSLFIYVLFISTAPHSVSLCVCVSPLLAEIIQLSFSLFLSLSFAWSFLQPLYLSINLSINQSINLPPCLCFSWSLSASLPLYH